MTSADGYHALRDGAGLIDRSADLGRLWLSGNDRRAYLQGLLTNDIVALRPGTGCEAAYLTAQGRMIADMRVFELGGALLVDLERGVAAAVREKWEAFVFSEDVVIEDRSDATSQIGVYGPSAARVLSAALHRPEGIIPGAGDAVTPEALAAMPLLASVVLDSGGQAAVVLRSDAPGVAGFDVVVPRAAGDALAARLLAAGAVAVDAESAEACRVESGRPRFGIDMTTETIPLEAGIEDRAISQTKGCYVGQEVIIRVLHRGHGRVARRLVGLALDGTGVPNRGAAIRSGDREVGAVTSAVRSPALGRGIALGYVHRDFTAPGTPLDVEGLPASVVPLPFA